MDYIMGLTSRCDSFDADTQQLRDSVQFDFQTKEEEILALETRIIALESRSVLNTSRSFLPAVMLCRNMVRASTLITTMVTVHLQALRKVIPISAVQRMTMLCTSISRISAGQELYLCFA